MKNVTMMMAGLAAGAIFAAATPAFAHGSGEVPASANLVSDMPLAAPARPAFNAFAFQPGTQQMSGSSYFYAPGAGPRCEIRMKRVQGRLYQTCE